MGNIVLLDELTINKIAAGEVIERPASVVKEMIENSIDAGAKHITVEIKNGGISFIRITDDGKGIQKDDVEMAFERHATSKIRSADDLQEVKSMGFRGEALASIASIANVELVSKQESDETGTRIVIEGGDVLSLDEIGCSKGTTITVRNLFYNTPVRYKFLKRDFTESGYIEDIISRMALIHPDVSIKFINTGKIVVSTNGNGNIKDVIYSIFGKEVANNLIDVDYEFENMRVTGVVGNPSISRSNRSSQIFYVNSRYVKDKTLNSAVEQAFKGMLPAGKFPFLVLNIEMPPAKVDVNVHPAKLEVRFAEEGLVFKAMYHAVKDSFLKQGITEGKNIGDENQIRVGTFEPTNIFDKEEKSEDTKTKNEIPTELKLSEEALINKLKMLQDELKKETEGNPEIKLTDEYKKMMESYSSYANRHNTPKVESISNEENVKNSLTEDTENNKEDTENTHEELHNIDIEQPEAAEEMDLNLDEVSNLDDMELTQEINIIGLNEDIVEDNNDGVSNKQNSVEFDDEIPKIFQKKNKDDFIQQNEENDLEQVAELNEENDLEQVAELNEDNNFENSIENQKVEENEDTELSFRQMYRKLFGKEPYGGREIDNKEEKKDFYTINEDDFSQDNLTMFDNEDQFNKPVYRFIGTAFDSYIILEIQNELYVMDQKLANERIMYEKVKHNFYNSDGKSSQMLLLPDLIELNIKQMDIAKDNKKLFEKAGFTLEQFDDNTIKLTGVPEVCVDLNTEDLFKDILEEINQAPRNDEEQKEKKFIDAIASNVAERIPVNTSTEDIENLIEALLSLKNPFMNSEGKPIVIKMTRYEIEKKFARK